MRTRAAAALAAGRRQGARQRQRTGGSDQRHVREGGWRRLPEATSGGARDLQAAAQAQGEARRAATARAWEMAAARRHGKKEQNPGIYKHHKEFRAAQGVKVVARGLQYAMAGTSLIVVKPGDDLGQSEAAAMQDINKAISLMNGNQRDENEEGTTMQELSRIKTCREGVYVQASSLGTLEAIIEHLKSPGVDVPVSGWNLGSVHKQDVMKATAMLKLKEEYAAILAFDVKVMPEASGLAAESGVKIFTADTVYKLVDSFTEHIKGLKEAKKLQCAAEAVFPCTLKIMPNRVYHNKDPIVCDVEVLGGVVKVGTPICVCVPSKDRIGDTVHGLGRISSIKTSNGNQIFSARKGVVSIMLDYVGQAHIIRIIPIKSQRPTHAKEACM